MNKKILNIILICLYVPLSIFCFMCYMGIDGVIGEDNTVVIALTNIIAYIGLFMPICAVSCMLLSNYLDKRNYRKWGYFIKFLPICLFVIMIIFDRILVFIR